MLNEVDFEELVVACLLVNQGLGMDQVSLSSDDFDSPWFREAFEVMEVQWGKKKFFDVFTVAADVKSQVSRQRVFDSIQFAFTPQNVHYYASKVMESSIHRQLKILALEMQGDDSADVQVKIDAVRVKLDQLKVIEVLELPDLRWDLQVMLNEILNPKRTLETCFTGLNRMIVGLKQSGLYVIGARPGVGKTVVGMQLAWELSRREDVLFFSLEMDKASLLNRVVSGELGIPLDSIERGNLLPEWKSSIHELIKTVENRLMISDRGGQTIAQIRAYLNSVILKRPIKAIFVDYLQLIQAANPKAPKYEQISQISMDLKNLAKEFGIPVIALAQLNRRVDQGKPDDRPNASDLRDSGQIEQDADVIIMLSRKQSNEDVLEDNRIAKGDSQRLFAFGQKSLITLDVVKNRHGATGFFEAKFDGEFSRVREISFAG
jgi:replicative DNA helicase